MRVPLQPLEPSVWRAAAEAHRARVLDLVHGSVTIDKAHPVFKGFMNAPVGRAFSRDDVREKVLRAYMGLVKQCDDQMGVLFGWLEKTGRMDDTMIVVTSDHGDLDHALFRYMKL